MRFTDYFAFASLAIAGGLGLHLAGEVPLPSLWIMPLALLALGLVHAFWRCWVPWSGWLWRLVCGDE